MANNLRELRLALLLTPRELAERIGTDAAQVERLEKPDRTLDEEWIDAIVKGLDVPRAALLDPGADIRAAVERSKKGALAPVQVCPIAARFAIQAMVAKLGGLKVSLALDEDALMTAVQNIIMYAEGDDDPHPEERLNRLSQALRIASLTILQSRGVVPGPQFVETMEKSLEGASRLIAAFSASLRAADTE